VTAKRGRKSAKERWGGYIDADVLDAIAAQAVRSGRTVADVIRQLLRQALRREDPPNVPRGTI